MTTRLTTYAFVFSLLCLTMDISGSDFGLPGYVTSKRIGLMFLSGILLLQSRDPHSTPGPLRWAMLAFYCVTLWAGLSSMVSDVMTFVESMLTIVMWGLLLFSLYAFDRILPPILSKEKGLYIRLMVTTGFLVTIATFVLLANRFGVSIFFSPTALRLGLDGTFAVGLNRYMNGMVFWNVFPLAVLAGVFKPPLRTYVLAAISATAFLLLCLISASRQNTGTVFLFLSVLVLFQTTMRSPRREQRRRAGSPPWGRMFLGMVILIYAVHMLYSSEGIGDLVVNRLVRKTQEDYATDSQGRMTLIHIAWAVAIQHPFFGVGDFIRHEDNVLEKDPHNGYMELLVEHGFPPLIALGMLFGGTLLWGLAKRRMAQNHADLWRVSYAFLFVYLVWSINLNVILREYMLVFAIVLMVHSIAPSQAKALGDSDNAPPLNSGKPV